MPFSQYLLRGALCLATVAGLASAQSIAVLTGAQGTSTSISLYSASPTATPLTPAGTIDSIPPGAFQIITSNDGTKYYVLSNSVPGVTVVTANLRTRTPIATSVPAAPIKGALSGDGKRLIILTASSAHMIDTATDQLLAPFGISGTPVDVAFSWDSQYAYVLSSVSGTAYITPIDLGLNTASTALAVAVTGNTASGLTMGPNGMLYLTAQNALIEVNPRPLSLAANSTLQVNGLPGKAQFTRDGAYAVAINKNPSTGAAMIFDIVNRSVTMASNANLNGAVLDGLLVANDRRIFVYSSVSKTIYELNLAGGFTDTGLRTNIPTQSVGSFIPSSEVQAQQLFVSATSQGVNTLYQVSLGTNTLVAQQAIPAYTAGQILAWMGASPTSGAAAMSGFNGSQTVSAGARSKPLVVRVTDSAGRPVSGARVDFVASGATFEVTGTATAAASTGSDGYAQLYAFAPASGTAQITATSAGAGSVTYTLTVPGSGTGGGTCTSNCSPSTMQVVSGNGQMVFEQYPGTQLLMVRLKDGNGNPVANQNVSFAVTQGIGTLNCSGIGDQFSYIPTGNCFANLTNAYALDAVTDASGYAGVKFLASSTFGQSWANTIVAATSAAGTANFNIITILSSLPNGGGQAPMPTPYPIAPIAQPNGYRVISGQSGQTVPAAIQMQIVAVAGPGSGQPIPGVALNVSGIGDPTKVPSATCANGIPLSDLNGVMSCDVVLGPVTTSSPYPIHVDVGGAVEAPLIAVVVAPGVPGKIQVTQGNGQSGKPGTQIVLKAIVTTSSGTPSIGAPLTWAVTQGSATLSNQSTQTDATGLAQATLTLGTATGPVVVRLTAGAGSTQTTATFNVTVSPSVGGIAIQSGNGQVTIANSAFPQPLVVKVTDSTGVAVAGASVTFTVMSGAATVNPANATSDASGLASATLTAGATAGAITVNAATSGFTVTFSLTSVPPGPTVDPSGFVNAASGAAGLAPCGVATVTGTGMLTGLQGTIVANNGLPGALPYSMNSISIAVNGIPAPIFWVSNTTTEVVAFQTPCEVTPGPATVTIGYANGTKNVSNVPVAAIQPGIFETTIGGKKYAVALHADGSYITPDNPARRGENIKLFLTGLGPVAPATGTNRVGLGGQTPLALLTVGINNGGVAIVGAEYMQGAIGIYAITITVPADTQAGAYQNLGFIASDPASPSVPLYANGSFLPIQ